jgi:AcrR family transcriptional regulator
VTDGTVRRRLSSDDRRAEIASAARRLFAENGYHATTTRQLARASGVSDALLYRHFESKEALLAYVIDEAIGAFSSLPPLDRMAPLPTDQLLTRLGHGFLERVEVNLDLVRILIGESPDPRFARFVDSAATALGEDLARRGTSPSAETGYLVARSFFGSLISFILLQRVLRMDDIHAVDADVYLAQLVAQTV